MDLVKRCPTCGIENAPTAARCGCGAFLIGVDLVEPAATDPLPSPVVEPTPAVGPAFNALPPLPVNFVASAPTCAHADCGEPNPRGSDRCVYCNRPLVPPPVAPAPTAAAVPVRRTLISLPAGLEARFELCEPLKAAGGEADLFIVRDRASGERAVLKLYRHGIEPRTEVLERVSRAAPEQLVRVIEYGRDEGVPYELLEYCEHGSLRALLKGKPLPSDAARTLLVELCDAVDHLHACGIVHRDLKPENVLIRGLLPLDLVLTDFGISSITDATMHYTSAARTLRYSAPEAGSNWVGRPTDYWALGMMLVEAISGRHPFEGLSEAVIAHALVTKPVDVSTVADPRWQRLCRGLLTRDPKQRWGQAEITRWLAGDDTMPVALEQVSPVSGDVAPYLVGEMQCRTPRELAVALAAAWSIGVKDLKRGMLRAWLQNDLRDQNLARAASDAQEALEQSDDERLLRLLLVLDPALPPVFKGYDLSVSGFASLVRTALEDENEARQTVFEVMERRLLEVFHVDALREATARFEQAKVDFEQTLELAARAGAPRTVLPSGREWQLRMLLFILEPPKDLLQSLRASAARVGGRAAQRCPWYLALGSVDTAGPAQLAAMVMLGPPAAQAGMEIERDRARRTLQAIAGKIDAHESLGRAHGAARDQIARTLDGSAEEQPLLAACEQVEALGAAVERSIEALFCSELYDAWPVRDPARIQALRRRIGDWAAWRAGESWRGFGDSLELLAVLDRRSYRVEIGTRFENRRIAYKYTASDIARMPQAARAAIDDVWQCGMPALPEFGTDLKLERPRDLQCPRCGARGRVELQEAWGSTSYPFSTTYACHEKVGIQCQTRLGRGSDYLGVPGAPTFVSEFIDAHAGIDPGPERMLAFETERIPEAWLARVEPSVDLRCRELLAVADADLRPGERIARQRLIVSWTGLTEVRYRFGGRDYVIWVPERVDVIPVALDHPLSSLENATPTPTPLSDAEPVVSPRGSRLPAAAGAYQERAGGSIPQAGSSWSTWLNSNALIVGVAVLLGCLVYWMLG